MILVPPPCPPFPANSNFTLRRRLLLPPSRRRIEVLPPPSAAVREVDAFTEYSGYLFELSTSEVETLTEYDISKIASIYRNKPLVVVRRVVQIGATLGKWFALRYLDSVNERSEQMFEVRAAELRKILVQLGPDLIPPSYLDELSLLQDQISPFSTEVAFNTIEQELGLPIDELFSEISPEPVAAASLGQVYQARLRSSGQVVAVKVQRPGVQAAISLDILILRFLAGLVRRAGKFNTDLQAVVDEWASSLFRSLRARTEKKQVEDSDSRMIVKQILSFTLTEKGAFVREILLQEFAKGLDALGLATVDCITSAAAAGLPFAASLSSSSMTEEDIMNLRTFQRLVLLLSGVPKNESSNTGVEEANPYKSQRRNSGEEASLVLYQFASVQEILPLLSVILELPPDLQQQVLRLPVDLTGKLMSRVAARTIRRAIL